MADYSWVDELVTAMATTLCQLYTSGQISRRQFIDLWTEHISEYANHDTA